MSDASGGVIVTDGAFAAIEKCHIKNSYMIGRDQPNSREKMHDFTAEFLKCVKFHGKFTERVLEIHRPHRRYFEVLRYCKRRNFQNNEHLLH